jgi:3-dehydroquinate synthase
LTITSKIIVGENIKELARYIENKKNIISITDSNVYGLYENYIPSKNLVVIGTGEKIKTLDTVSNIYDRLSSMGADRSYFILGIGGGLVCDVAGFVASTFMRGIHFGFVPTTLLAQVDASIGGKNGVNFKGYKNIIGVFRQPEFVFSTPIFLKTLKAKEFTCGMAEVIKHALIAESELLKFLEQKYNHIISFDDYAIKRIVTDSVKIKTNIVNMDEFELGERRKLNFGHTVGHALEKLSPGISHGHAVAIGMMFAARFSSQKEYVEWSEVRRIERLIKTFGLPTDLSDMNIRKQDIFEAVRMDKKKEDNELHFVFLKKIGEAVVEKISFEELEDAVQDLC